MEKNVPVVQSTSAALTLLKGNKVSKTAGGGKAFLKFDSKRTGTWLLGASGEDKTEEVFSLDLNSLQHGYVLWHNRKADRRLVPINQDLPQPQESIVYTDNKGKQQSDDAAEARSVEGTFSDGTQFVFETSTFGGRKCVDSVLGELFTRAAADSPYLFPQIKLETDSYDHNDFGQVFTPEMVAVTWFDGEGTPEADGGLIEDASEEEEEEEEKPKRRKRG